MAYMELYPNIRNIKKSSLIIKYLILTSIVISLICVLINKITMPSINWSFIVVVSIIYVWATILYSIKKNVNIASHVIVQTVFLCILLVLLDFIIGYKGWAFLIALPIVVSIANIIMLVLTIVSRKKYFKYALYQLLLSFISMFVIPMIFIKRVNGLEFIPFSLSSTISIITLVVTIILCGKDLKDELIRFFHI